MSKITDLSFDQVLPYLRDGKKARIGSWNKGEFIYLSKSRLTSDCFIDNKGLKADLRTSQILCYDWEVYD